MADLQKTNFLERALPLIEHEYDVIPLEGKSPDLLGKNWPSQATHTLDQVKKWADKWPNANVGVRRGERYHMIDIESYEWFAEATAHLPLLFGVVEKPLASVVFTGNAGLHIYVAGPKPAWARTVSNPRFKSKEETPNEKPALLEYPLQVVGPGSIHPNGRVYEARRGFGKPLPLPKEYVEWLQGLYAKDISPNALKCRPLKPGHDLRKILDSTELAGHYSIEETADKVFFNYHSKLGRCLVKGSSHRERSNNAHCGFYFMKKDPSDWGHYCHSASCQGVPGGQRKTALAALGLSLEDLLRPKCRDLAKSKNELDQRPLEFVVDRFIQEEGITGIGGPSGHGKTYLMLSLAKHISLGTQAWGFLNCKKFPILYLLAEGGDRALKKRLDELRIEDSEDFLVRTMSQGPTLALDDPGLVELAKGRVVFLDTFPRWLQGREENSSTQMAALFQLALEMLTAGAVAVVLAQHSTKGNKQNPFTMTADCVFRGSGDIVANMACGHGIYQLDHERRDRTLIHIECVKPRDFEPHEPFQLVGKPGIDKEGDFHAFKTPKSCGWFNDERKAFNAALKGPSPDIDERLAIILQKQAEHKTKKEIAKEMGLSERVIYKILKKSKKTSEPTTEEFAAEGAEDDELFRN